MIELSQNDREALQDLVSRGKMTAAEANIEMVRMVRAKVIVGSLPAEVRRALNAAVKAGTLGHMKKDGLKPEVYYHPNFEHIANGERNRIETESLRAIASVCV